MIVYKARGNTALYILRDRLMVGQRFLVPFILVRVQVPQQIKK